MELPGAFYEPVDDDRYEPTEATMSPWHERFQHGGPPSALALHALERAHPRERMQAARVAVDFLGPIPRATMRAEATIVRPGKRIELARVVLSVGARAVVAASVWRLAIRDDVVVPERVLARERIDGLPPVPAAQEQIPFQGMKRWAYGRAVEWRFSRGSFAEGGPAQVWTRLRIPLVAGRAITGSERVLAVADSANGVSRELEMRDYLFVPPGITVTLDRPAQSEWTFMAVTTHIASIGLGFTSGLLGDECGVLGTVSQPMLIEPRDPADARGGGLFSE